MRFLIVLATIAILLAAPISALAEKVYVIDELVVTIRQDNSANSSLVGRVKSLDALSSLNSEGGWTQVKTSSGLTGWIPSKYLTAKRPLALRLKNVQSENQDLVDKIESLENENQTLQNENDKLNQDLESSQVELDSVSTAYEKLKVDSKEYTNIKIEYSKARTELAETKAEVARLVEISDDSMSSRRLRWFLAGGGVLVIGWLAGMLSGRRRRNISKLY